jgi:hypothetical protein
MCVCGLLWRAAACSGTEGQSPDDDPKYNNTVGISAGRNIGAENNHFGFLSFVPSLSWE